MNAEISLKQVLSSIKQELRLSTTTDSDLYLMDLVYRTARRLGTTETYRLKDCKVTVENNCFDFPKEAKQIIAFRGDGNCISGVFIDYPFFENCGCNSFGGAFPLGGLATINDRRVYFLNQIEDGTEFQIAYTMLNVDCHGFLKISEEAEEAIINGTCWKYANAFPKDYTPEQRNTWKTDYMYQAGRCRSLATRRTWDKQKAQIRSKMLAILTFDGASLWFNNWLSNGFYYSNTP